MPDYNHTAGSWEPPEIYTADALIAASAEVLGRPDIAYSETESVFRINVLGLDWDMGVMVYKPDDETKIPTGANGRKVGLFLLHGGAGDYRSMQKLARMVVGKFGYKVTSMTYPGRLYLPDPSRNWPGDTVNADGSVRTPIWLAGETISPDEYEIVHDQSLRSRYGTRINARARPGTLFYDRMAAWPATFEEAMKTICWDHFPDGEYSIYLHGHSTGGPFVHMLCQRVDNIAGIVGIENSPFGYMYQKMLGIQWPDPFTDVVIRTWRDIARYKGAEVRSQESDEALMRLPWLMEDVFDDWQKGVHLPQFKAEYPLHYANIATITEAAKASAERLKMNGDETEALVAQYAGYTRELSRPNDKRVPPILLSICKHSRDHTEEAYREVVVPMFAAMNPTPKVRVVKLGTGTHGYEKPEDGLPMGLVPPVAKMWDEAIMEGYYVAN
ncbi:hypothetical protein OAJ57_03960 [Alphaproteobacteria bacterium]|nr:hypothetical protein [Alphaproteobacteria bacterium]